MEDKDLDSRVIEIRNHAKNQEFEEGLNLIRLLFQDSVDEKLGIERIAGMSYFDYVETIVFWWGDEFRDGIYQIVRVIQEFENDEKSLNAENFDQCRAGLLRFLITITSDPTLDKKRTPQSPQDYRSIIYGLSLKNTEIRKRAKKLLKEKKWKQRILEQWKLIAPELTLHKYFLGLLDAEKVQENWEKLLRKMNMTICLIEYIRIWS